MKKILTTVIAVMMVAICMFAFTACGDNDDATADLTVGAIMVGNETEGYTKAHMDGINAAVSALEAKGKKVQIVWKKDIPEDASCATAATETIAAGAKLVVTNSYGHQFQIGDVVTANPSVTFVSMTGDLAATSGKANYKNAFTNVYEARYISGVVAGMKLKQLIDDGTVSKTATPNAYTGDNVEIGYVGAYNYAEVVSGYTAFYLGVKSVVSNIVMSVKYTNSWFNFNSEKETAEALISDGCVIIGQHADSEGAPTACETAFNKGTVVYSVGYNVDMLHAAPHAALTSSANNWEVYYEYLFTSLINGETVATDWSKGYEANAVCITPLGTSCATGTQAKVDSTIAAIKAGTLKVFDCSKFTVAGASLTTYTGAYGMNNAECIKNGSNNVYYFEESVIRSAPYFDIRIDGITESGAAAN